MTITEYAILPFHSPPDLSDPVLRSLFDKLSAWQSECSGFPLRFYTRCDAPREVCLVTGWKSVEAHEAWIRGERNQELLRVFAPYVDVPKVRMVHVGVDFAVMARNGDTDEVPVVERYDGEASFEGKGSTWELVGRDLALDGDVYRFVGGGEVVTSERATPVERWVLRRIEL